MGRASVGRAELTLESARAQERRDHLPVCLRSVLSALRSAAPAGGEKGDSKRGWDYCCDFGRGFNGAVMTEAYPPLSYVVGSDLPSLGSEESLSSDPAQGSQRKKRRPIPGGTGQAGQVRRASHSVMVRGLAIHRAASACASSREEAHWLSRLIPLSDCSCHRVYSDREPTQIVPGRLSSHHTHCGSGVGEDSGEEGEDSGEEGVGERVAISTLVLRLRAHGRR